MLSSFISFLIVFVFTITCDTVRRINLTSHSKGTRSGAFSAWLDIRCADILDTLYRTVVGRLKSLLQYNIVCIPTRISGIILELQCRACRDIDRHGEASVGAIPSKHLL